MGYFESKVFQPNDFPASDWEFMYQYVIYKYEVVKPMKNSERTISLSRDTRWPN